MEAQTVLLTEPLVVLLVEVNMCFLQRHRLCFSQKQICVSTRNIMVATFCWWIDTCPDNLYLTAYAPATCRPTPDKQVHAKRWTELGLAGPELASDMEKHHARNSI